MATTPTWLLASAITICKTANGGFAAMQPDDFDVEHAVVFETWDALVYYLNTNWNTPA